MRSKRRKVPSHVTIRKEKNPNHKQWLLSRTVFHILYEYWNDIYELLLIYTIL